MWEIEVTDQFEGWWNDLEEEEQEAIHADDEHPRTLREEGEMA